MIKQTLEWAPFNYKTSKFITEGINNRYIVAEGSIRAGKTVALCIIASMYLETCPDKYHLVTGSKMGNAKLNIGVSDGYGLEGLFKGRCRWGKYKSNEALYIDTKTGEKIVIFAGGGKSDSYKSILGNSYGMWFATEINQHYDSDDSKESFVKVALGRQIASKKPITLWDLNPEHPKHRIYTEYIDRWKQQEMAGGYLYEHFTIKDNLSISEERKAEILSVYPKGTVWYQRDILGLRVAAEGIIYRQFADNQEMFIRDKAETNFMIVSIGIDYGATQGATTFKATGITPLFKEVWTLDEIYIKGLHSPEQIYEKFKEFYFRVVGNYGKVTHCFADYGALGQVITYGLNKYLQQQGIPLQLQDCVKGTIKERIQLDSQLFALNRRFILRQCTYMIDAYLTAVWDDKKIDTRLDDGTSDIDSLDASEYSIYSFYDKFMIGEIR